MERPPKRPCEICGTPTRSIFGVCRTPTSKEECLKEYQNRFAKSRREPSPKWKVCRVCGGPTWGQSGICTRTRKCRAERSRIKNANYNKNNPLFLTWQGMRQRVLKPCNPEYERYGARGITIHEPWKTNFRSFELWINSNLGPRPINATLDRIDNNGNYEPGNLRWADPNTQQRNRRDASCFGAGIYLYRDGTRYVLSASKIFDTLEEAIYKRNEIFEALDLPIPAETSGVIK